MDKEPRFKKCAEINCPLRLMCHEELEVIFTESGYCIDYFCKKANTTVYWE